MTRLIGDAAFEAWLAEALGASSAKVVSAEKLSGGAIQENWAVDVEAEGETRRLVLRRDAPATIDASRSREEEHALLAAAHEAGVMVPRPIGFCADAAVIGAPFALVERAGGVGYGPKVVRDRSLGGDRAALGRELGRQLARIHGLRPDAALAGLLGPKPEDPAAAEIALTRDWLDAMGAARPGLEWALRRAERNAPSMAEAVFCHRDYRTGNFMVDESGLTAVLDWEFAGWSDPMADIGWFCAECWRFSRPDLEGGGVCGRADFYAGYEAESGRRIDAARVRWWELMAHIRWAVIALQQGDRHARGRERSLHLALTGRMADPLEFKILKSCDGDQAVAETTAEPAPSPARATTSEGLDLLDEAIATLRERLAPQLSGEGRYLALLTANAIATARREAELGAAFPAGEEDDAALVAAIRARRRDADDALFGRLLAQAARRAWVADPDALTAPERARFIEETAP